jgi:hypothetical protein
MVGCQCHALAALPSGKRPGTGGVGLPRAGLDGCGKFIVIILMVIMIMIINSRIAITE